MKKILVSVFLLSVIVSVSSAQVFIGSRQAGMGGTGVASAVGLNAVAYNPAGLMKGPSGEFLLSLGVANQGLDQIANSYSSATGPGQFMIDNYDNTLDASGSLSGILGFNLKHIGISLLLPSITATLSKDSGTLVGSFDNLGKAEAVLTLGRSFSIPGIPIGSLDVGANIKSVYASRGSITIAGDPEVGNPTTTEATHWLGSGIGFDIGARTTIEIPMLADFSVGAALRNISQTIKYKPKTKSDTYTITASGETPTFSEGAEIEGPETEATYPTITTIGCAGTVPGIGLKIAVDIESTSGGTGVLAVASDTVTHLGLEYPLLLNRLILRGGMASGQNVSMTTLGAKINIPFVTLEIANIIDNRNSKNTSYVADMGIAF